MAFTEAQIVEALTVGSNAAFTEGLALVMPKWDKIATKVPSIGSSEFYGWIEDLPAIELWGSTRQLKELASHGYTIKNETYEASIKIKREDLEDDLIGKYAIIAKSWGRNSAIFPDKYSFPLLAAGFTTLCFDGQNYFDTDHPLGDTGDTYSNVIGNPSTDTGEPWFVYDNTQILLPIIFQERRPLKLEFVGATSEYAFFNNMVAQGVDGRAGFGFSFPQMCVGSKAPLTEANYNAAKVLLANMQSTNGQPLGTEAKVLTVGTANTAAAKKLILTQLVNGGDTNIYYNDVEVVSSAFVK
jgi:phage major head subunit gpT-like protein